jgi:hypothetical protein
MVRLYFDCKLIFLGVGGILDNRVTLNPDGTHDKRTLSIGTGSENSSHIYRKKEGSHSRFPGVLRSKGGKKWRSQWRYENWSYSIGSFSTEIDAANAYSHVQEHRAQIAALLAKVPKDGSKAEKKRIRAANLVIVKSYISFVMHPKVQVIINSENEEEHRSEEEAEALEGEEEVDYDGDSDM